MLTWQPSLTKTQVGMDYFTPPEDSMHEQDVAIHEFVSLFEAIRFDGGGKRARGLKPHWTVDPGHEAAIFSHLAKWKAGAKRDETTGAHPLVHLAWRALAIAWRETRGGLTNAGLTNVEKVRPALDAVGLQVPAGAVQVGKTFAGGSFPIGTTFHS